MRNTTRFFAAFFQIFVLPMEIIFHRDIGERYMAGFKVLLSWTLLILSGVMFTIAFGRDIGLSGTLVIICLSFLFLRNRKRELRWSYVNNHMVHSYYNGTPKFFTDYDETQVKMYLEPLVLIIVNGVLFAITFFFLGEFRRTDGLELILPGLAFMTFYFAFGSIILFVKEQITYALGRSAYLDAQDEMIESEQISRAFNPHNKNRLNDLKSNKKKLDSELMRGFSIPGRLPSDKGVREDISKIYEKMKPHLRNAKDNNVQSQERKSGLDRTPVPEPDMDRDKY